MSKRSPDVQVAVLDERVKNLCGKVKGILERCDDNAEATKNINDTVIRLEDGLKTLDKKVDTLQKPIEIKLLYEVVRLLIYTIVVLLGITGIVNVS